MKFALMLLILPTYCFANVAISINFKSVKQKVVVKTETSHCMENGKSLYKIEAVTPDQEYNLVCKIKAPNNIFESSTPIRLIQNFKYPETILKDIEESTFVELKKSGTAAIKNKEHHWGTEYFWSTPTKGAAYHTYLCPNKLQHCFKVIHGAVLALNFEVRDLK